MRHHLPRKSSVPGTRDSIHAGDIGQPHSHLGEPAVNREDSLTPGENYAIAWGLSIP